MQDLYNEIHAKATRLAGEPGDFPQRVALLHSIYLDSKGNHAFPQVALHGALWASAFFSVSGTMGSIISYRYFYHPSERRKRHQMLTDFSDGFKATNRSVFIDTYTNYYYTKQAGQEAGAEEVIRPELLMQLNRVHSATRQEKTLSTEERSEVFDAALRWEQEVTVGPGIMESLGKIDCPILTMFLLKPVVRFKYFPNLRYFRFRNFSDTQERIRNAERAYQLAEKVGWDRVTNTMQNYGVLTEQFFQDRERFMIDLHERNGCKM